MLLRILILLLLAGTASADLRGLRTTPQGSGPCGSAKKNAVARGQQVRLEQMNLPASTSFALLLGNDSTEVQLGSFSTDASGKVDVLVTIPMTFPIPSIAGIRGTIGDSLLLFSDPLAVVDGTQCDMSWASSSQCGDFDHDGVCNDDDECPFIPNPCPTGPACGDGADNDQDGLVDFGSDPFVNDPGCTAPTDTAETEPSLECDDGIDNDGDGFKDRRFVLQDFGPGVGVQPVLSDTSDPACTSVTSPKEGTQCDDSADNDGDTFVDFDGRLGTLTKDPECRAAWWDDETTVPGAGAAACGLAAATSLAGLARLRAWE